MNLLIRLLFNKGVLILGAVVIIVLANERMQWVDTSPIRDASDSVSSTEQGDAPVLQNGGSGSSQSVAIPQSAPTPKKSTGVSITFPYAEAIRNEPYYVDWVAQSGDYATIRLVQAGEESVAVPGCTALTVVPGTVSTCIWKPGAVDQLKSREGYNLELSVYTSAGAVVSTARTGTFNMVTTLTTPLQSYEDETYGWSVRFPESWTKKVVSGQATFADSAGALNTPLASDETFTIEFCSLAKVDCQSKRDTFLLLPGARTGSLVNKRTTMVVTPEGNAYKRRDMFDRSGILYMVTTRAVTADGVIRSPYTRKALEEIDFEAPRLSSEVYTFSRSSRTGTLTLELTDGRITYARLFTTATNCETKLDTTTFKSVNTNGFAIVRGACTITATKDADHYTLEEKECDAIHTGSCTFEGRYDKD